MTSFYSESELAKLGFKKYGENVLISRKASIYGSNKISFGNNIRVDDFCILSGNITIGNYVHIAAYSALFAGNGEIQLYDFSGLSSRCVIYAESDDYSGYGLTQPVVPDKYRNVYGKKVILKKHVLIGTGSTVLPDVTIGEGSAVGCMSLVNKSLQEWGIYVGCPCKKIKDRNKHLLKYEKKLLIENSVDIR